MASRVDAPPVGEHPIVMETTVGALLLAHQAKGKDGEWSVTGLSCTSGVHPLGVGARATALGHMNTKLHAI